MKLLHRLSLIFVLIFRSNSESCTQHGEVRLVGGTTEREGRVEICISRRWGTICDDLWDSRDAEVVCHQLGFAFNGAVAAARAHFGQGTGPIVLDNLECRGTERNLLECPSHGLGISDCTHAEDASVYCQPSNFSCINGEVRLAGGQLTHEGRVEVCFDDQFGTICDDEWERLDAAVVCNQLGFPREDAIALIRTATFGEGIGNIFLDNVRCIGHEDNITQCGHNGILRHNCRHREDAGVLCKPIGTRKVCEDGELRLVNGRYPSEGRVEICFNDHWGTICDDHWDAIDAIVACSQLGFSNREPIPLGSDAFLPGNGTIFLDSIRCTGREQSLHSCLSNGVGIHNCDHNEDAGLVCKDVSNSSLGYCEDGDIRLANGTDGRPYEGRVEVCRLNHWGTVCDDHWDSDDALVVCNELGFPGISLPLRGSFYGRGKGVVWYSDVQCTGKERSLSECTKNTFPSANPTCTHSRDANVICTAPGGGTDRCTNGEIRLAGGSVDNEGRVELCFHEHWGAVCSTNWDNSDAAVVCKQLGFVSEGSLAAVNGFFGVGAGPILLDNIGCVGNESQLLECSGSQNLGVHQCDRQLQAGVICPVVKSQRSCENGDVRLRGGSSPAEGRVEICVNSRWGTVCSGTGANSWDQHDAQVVCQQLGFNGTQFRGIPTYDSFAGEMVEPIFLEGVHCVGNERGLLDCPGADIGFITQCDHSKDVGVVCSRIPCSENQVRLVNNLQQSSEMGRVEVCVEGIFRRISLSGFGAAEASAICKQPGFAVTNGAFFGQSQGRLYSLMLSESGAVNGTIERSDLSQNTSDVGLICDGEPTGCTSGTLRLAGGETGFEGRVEVCLGGQWGTMCDDSWDNYSAAVVCKQLGLPFSGARTSSFGGNYLLPILLDDLKCTGTEESILHCQQTRIGAHDCTHKEDAGVQCGQAVLMKAPTSGETSDSGLLMATIIPIGTLALLIIIVVIAIIVMVVYSRTKTRQTAATTSSRMYESGNQFKFEKRRLSTSTPSLEEEL